MSMEQATRARTFIKAFGAELTDRHGFKLKGGAIAQDWCLDHDRCTVYLEVRLMGRALRSKEIPEYDMNMSDADLVKRVMDDLFLTSEEAIRRLMAANLIHDPAAVEEDYPVEYAVQVKAVKVVRAKSLGDAYNEFDKIQDDVRAEHGPRGSVILVPSSVKVKEPIR